MVDRPESRLAKEPALGSYLFLPLKGVAIASAIIALASLTVLVVVASIDNVDTLSTVALAVAIVTFVVQIIVFIVQGAAANSQMVQNQMLHGELQSLLASISERAQGTHAAVTKMNERMLGALIEKSSLERRSIPDERVVQDGVRSANESPMQSASQGYMPREPKPDDSARLQTLRTFPAGDRLKKSLEVLRELEMISRVDLRFYAEDERNTLERGTNTPFDPGLGPPIEGVLLDRGLVAEIPTSTRVVGRPLYVLTPEGREVARLLTADGPIPSDVDPELTDMRVEVARFRESLRSPKTDDG